MLKTEQILNAKFTPVAAGAYSASEVDSYLKAIVESYEQMTQDRNSANKRLAILADKVEKYREDEDAIKAALLDAHKLADKITKESKLNADKAIADSSILAEKTVEEAKDKSSKIVDAAKEEAKEIIGNAKNAVASLTERAQKETSNAINAAKIKADEIISQAQEKAAQIVKDSEENYKYYTSELKRVKKEFADFRAMIEKLYDSSQSVSTDYNNDVINTLLDNKIFQTVRNNSVIDDKAFSTPKETNDIISAKPEISINPVYDDSFDLLETNDNDDTALPASLDDVLPPPIESSEVREIPMEEFDFGDDGFLESLENIETDDNEPSLNDLEDFLAGLN